MAFEADVGNFGVSGACVGFDVLVAAYEIFLWI